jgi:quinohemoprotein ethanol dehydrogenase
MRKRALIPIALMAIAASVATAQQTRRAVDDRLLRKGGAAAGEWLTYGLDQAETRFSPLSDINTSNVGRLGLAWSYDVGSGGGGQEATPLVANDTVYGITNWSIVVAVDARTGKEKWRWDPQVNQTAVRPEICCGVVNRGIAVYQGMVIAPVIDGRLQALDAETGRPVWETRVAYPQDHYTITMAPRIANGIVIIGASGGDRPTRGFFDAYDALTGRRAWRCYTVPGDPAKPFENAAMKKAAETWDKEWWKHGGGGAVWDGMAYDAEFTCPNPSPGPSWSHVASLLARLDPARGAGHYLGRVVPLHCRGPRRNGSERHHVHADCHRVRLSLARPGGAPAPGAGRWLADGNARLSLARPAAQPVPVRRAACLVGAYRDAERRRADHHSDRRVAGRAPVARAAGHVGAGHRRERDDPHRDSRH